MEREDGMGTKRAAGLLVAVPRVGRRRPGLKRILRALAASGARQQAVEARRGEEAVGESVVFRRVWERG
jgi:hypothetical protein